MNEHQVKHMVGRFLGWQLPDNFNPDGGVSFRPIGNEGTPHEYRRTPSGTNLLDAVQAETMVRHMIEGMPVELEADDLSPEDHARIDAAWEKHRAAGPKPT